MANYNCVFRTNYFHVKDIELFKQLVGFMKKSSEDLEMNIEPHGIMLGGYGSPSLYLDCLDEDDAKAAERILETLGIECTDDDMFYDVLQKCVAEDDAILFKIAGHEKLRYVTLDACCITSKGIDWIDVDSILGDKAVAALKNKEWVTRMDY